MVSSWHALAVLIRVQPALYHADHDMLNCCRWRSDAYCRLNRQMCGMGHPNGWVGGHSKQTNYYEQE